MVNSSSAIQPAFFTIGYERLSQGQLVDALTAAGVRAVVDVREVANSRRAGFSKRLLAAGLAEAGVGYTHLKALGTPKAGRTANRSGDMETFWAVVDEALARPEAGLAMAELMTLARAGPVCLLCLEHDWRGCHRARIAERLIADGFSATHLAPEA